MLDELRKNDWTPKSVNRKSRALSEAIRKVEGRYGRDARDSEVMQEMGISSEEYHQILQDGRNSNLFSLEAMGFEDFGMPNQSHHKDDDPLKNVQSGNMKNRLTTSIRGLPERERIVVSLYYDMELNLREIGEVIGVSESRTSQLMSQALARLRARMHEWIP
ncbi:MAG: hypothetical protein BMS9Abin26_2093 [Gammaproteobacteria bacterium]|nr:MAG: hypothetical protein BMS9Abin26_2093 [Gammaproteobacteria bacterium]